MTNSSSNILRVATHPTHVVPVRRRFIRVKEDGWNKEKHNSNWLATTRLRQNTLSDFNQTAKIWLSQYNTENKER